MTLDEELKELSRIIYIKRFLKPIADEAGENLKSVLNRYTNGANHRHHKKYDMYFYLSTHSLDLIRKSTYDFAHLLLDTSITRDPQNETDSLLCYGDTLQEKADTLSLNIRLPYLFGNLGVRHDFYNWWQSRFYAKEGDESFVEISDDDLTCINNCLHRIGKRMLSFRIEWERPERANIYPVDIVPQR